MVATCGRKQVNKMTHKANIGNAKNNVGITKNTIHKNTILYEQIIKICHRIYVRSCMEYAIHVNVAFSRVNIYMILYIVPYKSDDCPFRGLRDDYILQLMLSPHNQLKELNVVDVVE